MKHLTAITLTGLLVACSAAEPTSPPKTSGPPVTAEATAVPPAPRSDPAIAQSKQREFCKDQSLLAASIMNARQAGSTMSEMMEIPDKGSDGDGARALIIDSFKYPKMSTESNQESVITEFENQTYLRCTEALAGSGRA